MKIIKNIWITIPAFNEAENLNEIIPRIHTQLEQFQEKYTILVIDDGSTDATNEILNNLKNSHNNFQYILFRSNHGKAAALKAGFEYALDNDADVLVMMDADGQDSPEEIGKLISEYKKGFDLVTGARTLRQDRFIKRNTSKIYNFITKKITNTPGIDFNSGFKVMSRELALEVTQMLYGELHRYITVIAHWSGFQITEISVDHKKRIFGSTKYGISRFWRGFIDLLTVKFLMSYQNRPSHLFGGIGGISLLTGLGSMTYLLVVRLMGDAIGGRPLLNLSVLLITVGLQLILFGFLAELIVYSQKKKGK